MLNEQMKNQLIKLHKDCFQDGDYAEFFFANRLPSCKAYVIEEDNEPLSACYARFFPLVLEGRPMVIPFLTGVATSPKHRYKGYARMVVEKAKSELKADGYPFVILHPFNHDFYRKLGFETINYKTSYQAKETALDGVEFKPLLECDLPLVSELYNRITSTYSSYKQRDLKEFELLVGNSLKHGGVGYVIYENSIPKGYVWCEDGACQEAIVERLELLDGFPLRSEYSLTIMGGKTDYSMGAMLDLENMLKAIPYCKDISAATCFCFNGTSYQLTIKNGNFFALDTIPSKATELSERELVTICLGQGDKVKNNPFINIIPTYNLVCYEIY